jgi:hypothetical protein
MNLNPVKVIETCPLTRAYRAFRTLGLRHIVVGMRLRTHPPPPHTTNIGDIAVLLRSQWTFGTWCRA